MQSLRHFFLLLVLTAAPLAAQDREAKKAVLPRPAPDAPERIEMTRVQILLDRAGFRPGKIDGLGGEFTQKAADRYAMVNGIPPGQFFDLSSVPQAYRDYAVTESDKAWIGPQASSPAAQEKLKAMKYADLWELVAERFHCDREFLRELNPGVTTVDVGTVLRVPDVEEFRMDDVAALEKLRREEEKARKAAAEAAKVAAAEAAALAAADPSTTPLPTPSPTSPPPAPTRRIVLLRDDRILEVYEGDTLLAAFPCTPGSGRVPVPVGTWRVIANILLPYYRWDKSVLESGVKSDNAYNLPPGPNNPVGIVWMAINRPSVGMHGTPWPDQIGRNESSGCIRLSNWDAFTLSQMIVKGTPVEVR